MVAVAAGSNHGSDRKAAYVRSEVVYEAGPSGSACQPFRSRRLFIDYGWARSKVLGHGSVDRITQIRGGFLKRRLPQDDWSRVGASTADRRTDTRATVPEGPFRQEAFLPAVQPSVDEAA